MEETTGEQAVSCEGEGEDLSISENRYELLQVKQTRIELIMHEAEEFGGILKQLHADTSRNNVIMMEHIQASNKITEFRIFERISGGLRESKDYETLFRAMNDEIQQVNQLLTIIFTKSHKMDEILAELIKAVKKCLLELQKCIQNTLNAVTAQSVLDEKIPTVGSFQSVAPKYTPVSELEKEWHSLGIHGRLEQVLKAAGDIMNKNKIII